MKSTNGFDVRIGMEWNGVGYTFLANYDRCRGGNLARVANLEEASHKHSPFIHSPELRGSPPRYHPLPRAITHNVTYPAHLWLFLSLHFVSTLLNQTKTKLCLQKSASLYVRQILFEF